jgi:transposase-like protein
MDNIAVPPTTSEDAARSKRVLFYTLEKKHKIVQEAFSQPNLVRTTARKWRVQPNQIRKWRQNIRADQVLPAYPYPCAIEERTIVKDYKNLKMRSKGRPAITPPHLMEQLLPFLEQLQERGNAVSPATLMMELLCVAPELLAVGFVPLRCRVLRFVKNNNFTFRVVTHKVQDHWFHMVIIDDWTRYINRQIVASQYLSDCIMNFDETNVDFDPAPWSTLCKIGEKSVSLKISGHSGRATVMLGCTASGHKFPAYIIWKGVWNGRIDRECRANMYPLENQVYTVQPKGWMDGDAYKNWVQRVVAPYNLPSPGPIFHPHECRKHHSTSSHRSGGRLHPGRLHSNPSGDG